MEKNKIIYQLILSFSKVLEFRMMPAGIMTPRERCVMNCVELEKNVN